jgi:hypothetical protein
LVVFDFDETLTVATFRPQPGSGPAAVQHCIDVSFKSPWVEGRLQKLDFMLSALSQNPSGRKLAVLTRNPDGVQNVTFLLDSTGLSKYFDAVWCMPLERHPSAYRENGQWRLFRPQVEWCSSNQKPEVEWCSSNQKPDMLRHLVDHTQQWLPHVGSEFKLKLDNIVLVDDDDRNFENSETGARVARGCKVAKHEGILQAGMESTTLGGIGARSPQDFASLQHFIAAPWLRGAKTASFA